jgi:hypothetical protein
MTPVLCPTCQVDTWIVELPIVEEFTFDSESGRIAFIGTDEAPGPDLESAQCFPSGHPAPRDTEASLKEELRTVLARLVGTSFFKHHRTYEVQTLSDTRPAVFKCPRCNGSEWLVGLPNTYLWSFNSRLGILNLESDAASPALEVVYAHCIGCDHPADDDERVQIEERFIDSLPPV